MIESVGIWSENGKDKILYITKDNKLFFTMLKDFEESTYEDIDELKEEVKRIDGMGVVADFEVLYEKR